MKPWKRGPRTPPSITITMNTAMGPQRDRERVRVQERERVRENEREGWMVR